MNVLRLESDLFINVIKKLQSSLGDMLSDEQQLATRIKDVQSFSITARIQLLDLGDFNQQKEKEHRSIKHTKSRVLNESEGRLKVDNFFVLHFFVFTQNPGPNTVQECCDRLEECSNQLEKSQLMLTESTPDFASIIALLDTVPKGGNINGDINGASSSVVKKEMTAKVLIPHLVEKVTKVSLSIRIQYFHRLN